MKSGQLAKLTQARDRIGELLTELRTEEREGNHGHADLIRDLVALYQHAEIIINPSASFITVIGQIPVIDAGPKLTIGFLEESVSFSNPIDSKPEIKMIPRADGTASIPFEIARRH